jgi:hypothetical protein
LAALAAVLFVFDPAHSSFYPNCIFKRVTGWSCPACGCLRATHQLLHGHLATAFQLNPLYIVMLPLLIWISLDELLGTKTFKKRTAFGWIIVGSLIVFGVVRNLPPFLAWSGR